MNSRLLSFIVAIIILTVLIWLQQRGDRVQYSDFAQCSESNLILWAGQHGVDMSRLSVGNFLYEVDAVNSSSWVNRLKVRRGLRASTNIRPGDAVVSLPSSLLLSVENARKTELADAIDAMPQMDSYTILTLYILQERAKGSSSSLYPYLCQLPQSFDTTLFWPKAKLQQEGDKEGIDLLLKTANMQETVIRRYNRHVPLLTHLFPHRFSHLTHSFRDFAWAHSAVLSRNWGVSSRSQAEALAAAAVVAAPVPAYGNATIVMAPIADLANHGGGGGDGQHAYAAWLAGGERFGLVARRPYRAGDEIYTSYGPGCRPRFLVTYGFAPADSDSSSPPGTAAGGLPCEDAGSAEGERRGEHAQPAAAVGSVA